MKEHLKREIHFLWMETELPWSINTIGNIVQILYGMIRYIENDIGTNPEQHEEDYMEENEHMNDYCGDGIF